MQVRRVRRALLACAALGLSAYSACAADLGTPVVRGPIVAPVRWDGVYGAVSAGASLTKANETLQETSVSQSTGGGPETESTADIQSGNNAGAVFTFTMGYNVVWSSWLAGIQSEVSLNKNIIRIHGPSLNVSTFAGTTELSGTAVSNELDNQWTISEMARIGYLMRPDLLVYGLVGWSWGGFRWNSPSAGLLLVGSDITSAAFTMNGFTYGAGVEKDFGGLRAFVQYKGINYRSTGVDVSQSNASIVTGATGSSSSTYIDNATRTFSAVQHQITAGITVPLHYFSH